jgi:transcriptional regulator with GAF, ATPase, and Fis domain
MQQRLQQAKTELRQRAEREALVNRIALALNCERDPQRVLDEIVRQLAVPMNCDCCMVVRALPELNSISVEAEYWPNFAKGVTLQTPIPVTTDWQKVREVLQQNQPIAITTDKAKEQEEEPLYLGKEESFLQILHHPLSPVFQSLPPEQRPMAMLLTPIFVREQYYGHLLVAYLQPRFAFLGRRNPLPATASNANGFGSAKRPATGTPRTASTAAHPTACSGKNPARGDR